MPYNAGHSLGGTIWKIIKDQEEFVYAVDYNHKSEKYVSTRGFGGGGIDGVVTLPVHVLNCVTNDG